MTHATYQRRPYRHNGNMAETGRHIRKRIGAGTAGSTRLTERQIEAASASNEVIHALDLLDDPVVIFDKDWRYQFVNKVGWEVMGRKKSEVLGKNVWDLYPHLVGSEYQRAAMRAMKEQQKIEIEEYYPHRQAWYRTKFYPSKHSLVAQMHNITDLVETKKINDQLTGTLEEAMTVYWSEENRHRREKHKNK